MSPLERDEVPQAVALLSEFKVSFGGLADRQLYKALCTSPMILTVVARTGQSLDGIAVIELSRKWIYRRPWVALRMIWSRLFARTHSRTTETHVSAELPPFVLREACPEPWSLPGPKTVFIGVRPGHRGSGLASSLYEGAFSQLVRRGFRTIRARIAPGNLPSIALHARTGWTLYADGDVVTALRQLN